MAISQLLRELYGLKDYDVMTSRRRYVIKMSNFDPTKSVTLFQSIIPPNFVAISQLLRELYDLQDYDGYDVTTSLRHRKLLPFLFLTMGLGPIYDPSKFD